MGRVTYYLPGMEHKAPIPAAAKVGNVVYSSAISGKDESDEHPESVERQVELAFGHMAELVRLAGGDVGNIVRVTVHLRDRSHKRFVDDAWLTMFPDPADRPARHAVTLERPGKALVQLEFVAVVGEGAA